MQGTFLSLFLVWSTLLTFPVAFYAVVLLEQPVAISSSCSPDDEVDETTSEPAVELRPDQLPRTA